MPQSDRQFGSVTVLTGEQNGKYPDGNSLWIRGREAAAIVDPTLTVARRGGELAGRADLIVQSHVHEDHLAGLHLFPDAKPHAHCEDAPGLWSLTGLLAMYGYGGLDDAMGEVVVSQFNYVARPDTRTFEDGATFDLGGTRLHAIHLPGHTRGHCALFVEPEGVLFLGDIDLSSFGPYYGDAWSDLDDFERSLEKVRHIDARIWVSSHHVGVIEDRPTFLARLNRFGARIREREQALVDFLQTPRSVAEMVAHRFLYPAHAQAPFIDAVEQRSIEQHLDRLIARGHVERCEAERYRRGDS